LKILVPFLQTNEKRAFVQAAQRFEIKGDKILSRAYSFQQRIFYDHVCPGMSALNTIFMTGTNMLIRKDVLDEIGGFDESTLTEDIRTSLLLHQKGWEGVYVKETVAVGYPPPDIASYHRQQRRWAIGTFQNFFKAWKSFFHSPNSLRIEQWLQYLGWNGTWYFQGFCNLFLVWSSVGFILTGFKPYIGALDTLPMVVVILTIVYQTINEHNRNKTGYFTLFLSQAIFLGNSIIFVLAFIDLILGRHMFFHVTKKVENSIEYPSPIFTAYHSLFVCVSIIAICFSLWRNTNYSWTFLLWTLFFTFQSLVNLLFHCSFYRKLNIELLESKNHVCQ
jgi:cellulose synthase (UDP-forming)